MRYFNKYYDFCDHSPLEIYLEDFKADKNVNGYNEEFYLKIYHLRMEEKKNESANPFNTNEVSSRIFVYNQLPDIIQRQIENLQLFLLGIVSPSVYTMMHMYFNYVDSKAWDLVKEYWKEKERNTESMSSYLKKLYEVEWIDMRYLDRFYYIHKYTTYTKFFRELKIERKEYADCPFFNLFIGQYCGQMKNIHNMHRYKVERNQ